MAVILLVEDEEQVRVLAESFLETAGHTTLSAGSIEQAFALLASPEPIDLLFIDLNLKGESEAGLSLAVKAVEMRPELKILYTSGQAVTDGMTALFVKNSAFLPKPSLYPQKQTIRLVRRLSAKGQKLTLAVQQHSGLRVRRPRGAIGA